MISTRDVVALLQQRYPESTAAEWDFVGQQVQAPTRECSRILFVIDVTKETVAQAMDFGADLVVSHHPLFFGDESKIDLADALLAGGCSLYVAHTNADVAAPGVNDALARSLGLSDLVPLVEGHGRIGTLASPIHLEDFAKHVLAALPATHHGVRIGGKPDSLVHRVAVAGGSGSDFMPAALNAQVDVFVTADCKHHVAQDFLAAGSVALVDVSHWASEWPWLQQAADLLICDLGPGTSVEVLVSTTPTDPWSGHLSGGLSWR